MIQGGCPQGTGTGGPGYKFRDEPVKGEYTLGAFAMANSGPNTNGSQFFITIDDCTRKLSKDYSLFGYVVEGMDVAQATAGRRRDAVGDGRGARPLGGAGHPSSLTDASTRPYRRRMRRSILPKNSESTRIPITRITIIVA